MKHMRRWGADAASSSVESWRCQSQAQRRAPLNTWILVFPLVYAAAGSVWSRCLMSARILCLAAALLLCVSGASAGHIWFCSLWSKKTVLASRAEPPPPEWLFYLGAPPKDAGRAGSNCSTTISSGRNLPSYLQGLLSANEPGGRTELWV